jgi:hypothetical protein
MPRSIVDKRIAYGRQRLMLCDIVYRLEGSAREDYCPWMSDAEFCDTVAILFSMAQHHLNGRLPSTSEMSRSTGIPQMTLYGKLNGLMEHGMIEQDGRRHYSLHPEYFNKPHMIAGFRRRLTMLRNMSGKIFETMDWQTLI